MEGKQSENPLGATGLVQSAGSVRANPDGSTSKDVSLAGDDDDRNISTEKKETDKAEDLEEVIEESLGVYLYKFGAFDVYIVFREAFRPRGSQEDTWRYRVYIPSLSCLKGSIGGFNVLVKELKESRDVRNNVYLDGKTNLYLKRCWFPNTPLFANAFIGRVPFTDNSQVEISFKARKHHTDLGVIARQRKKGMNLVEYVKRAADEAKPEASRVSLALLEKAKEYKKKNSKEQVASQVKKRASKRKNDRLTLHALSLEIDPLQINHSLIEGVFKKKAKRKRTELQTQLNKREINGSSNPDVAKSSNWKNATFPQEEKNNAEDKHGPSSNAPSSFDNSASDVADTAIKMIPDTQESRVNINEMRESWNKTRESKSPVDPSCFMDMFVDHMENTFRGWKSIRIGEFFTKNVTGPFNNSSMAPSTISKIKSRKQAPGKALRRQIMSFCMDKLPKMTADNPENAIDFSLIPAANELVSSVSSGNDTLKRFPITYGDAVVTLEDIRRLIREENSSTLNGPSESYWLSDEIINMTTNLYCTIRTPSKVFFFNSLCVESIVSIFLRTGIYATKSEEERKEAWNRLALRTSTGRQGQVLTFRTSEISFAPCHVNENHWVGFRMRRETLEIEFIDPIGNSRTGERYSEPIRQFVSDVDGLEWKYKGMQRRFPKQRNNMDCGVLVLLAARQSAIDGSFDVPGDVSDLKVMNLWRRRIVHNIIVGCGD